MLCIHIVGTRIGDCHCPISPQVLDAVGQASACTSMCLAICSLLSFLWEFIAPAFFLVIHVSDSLWLWPQTQSPSYLFLSPITHSLCPPSPIFAHFNRQQSAAFTMLPPHLSFPETPEHASSSFWPPASWSVTRIWPGPFDSQPPARRFSSHSHCFLQLLHQYGMMTKEPGKS